MESFKKLGTLVAATIIVWLSVLLVSVLLNIEFVSAAGAILALISTMTIWSMWALDQYGINVDGTPREVSYEKPKREEPGAAVEDARIALLLSMLTPDERDRIRAGLLGDLRADGEVMTLADLLEEQQAYRHTGR